jgi:hypothetical protein
MPVGGGGFAKFMTNTKQDALPIDSAAIASSDASVSAALVAAMQEILPFEFLLLILATIGVVFIVPQICGCKQFWKNCFTPCRWWYPPSQWKMDVLNFIVNIHWVIVIFNKLITPITLVFSCLLWQLSSFVTGTPSSFSTIIKNGGHSCSPSFSLLLRLSQRSFSPFSWDLDIAGLPLDSLFQSLSGAPSSSHGPSPSTNASPVVHADHGHQNKKASKSFPNNLKPMISQ